MLQMKSKKGDITCNNSSGRIPKLSMFDSFNFFSKHKQKLYEQNHFHIAEEHQTHSYLFKNRQEPLGLPKEVSWEPFADDLSDFGG